MTTALTEIEDILANDRPFGDYRYIEQRTRVHYERRLEMLGEHLPVALTVREGLTKAEAQSRYRVLGDPTVRSAINTALGYFKLGGPEIPLDETNEVLHIAAQQLAQNSRVAPLMAGVPQITRLGRASYYAWIWSDERNEDIPAQSFRRLFDNHLATDAQLSLCTPDKAGQRMLIKGARLLAELLPKLTPSALSHTHVVCTVKSPLGITSVTNPSLLGAVFFSPVVLKHPWRVAEYLLHESLHLKFIDLEHTHSMLRRGYIVEESPKIPALWNRSQPDNSNEWPVNRVLTVLHTYTCLALYFKVVERRAPELEKFYGPLHDLDPVLSARRALDRAHYLAQRITEFPSELGPAGERFVSWLKEVLRHLDPCPPPIDTHAHLLLDLYDRETEQINKLIGKSEIPVVQEIVTDLVQHEITNTLRTLVKVNNTFSQLNGGANETHSPSTVVDDVSKSDLAGWFCFKRSFVSQTLRTLLDRTDDRTNGVQQLRTYLDHQVRELLEDSAMRVNSLMDRLAR